MTSFEIYWSMLSDQAKLALLDELEKSEKDLINETNWDTLPMTEVIVNDD